MVSFHYLKSVLFISCLIFSFNIFSPTALADQGSVGECSLSAEMGEICSDNDRTLVMIDIDRDTGKIFRDETDGELFALSYTSDGMERVCGDSDAGYLKESYEVGESICDWVEKAY